MTVFIPVNLEKSGESCPFEMSIPGEAFPENRLTCALRQQRVDFV